MFGYVEVHEYSNSSWSLLGDVITIAKTTDAAGVVADDIANSVTISGDGSTVAYSSRAGYVYVYEYTNGSWSAKGSGFNKSGFNTRTNADEVALSSDGTIIAIATRNVSNGAGYIDLQKYSTSDQEWKPLKRLYPSANGWASSYSDITELVMNGAGTSVKAVYQGTSSNEDYLATYTISYTNQ